MLAFVHVLLLGAAALASPTPTIAEREQPSLNAAAFAEAQPRDNTATRAVTAGTITASGAEADDPPGG